MWKTWALLACLLGAGAAAGPLRHDAETELTGGDAPASGSDHPVTVQVQGGIEGYTGPLSPRIDLGATWGVSLNWEPTRVLGFEVGYSGAANELRVGPPDGSGEDPNPDGPDLLRNGGYLILTPGYRFQLPSSKSASFKPYALGGIGVDRYSPQGLAGALGYSAQTVPNLPFGAGLKARLGQFSADARFNYAWEFSRRFSIYDDHPMRVQGQVLVGASF